MSADRSDLETLFAPPAGEHGTHMLLCGLSADAETLERALAAFTNEAPTQRRAGGLVRGLLMLDASNRITAAQPVAALMQLAPCAKELWRARTTLLHAKVALMGFGPSRCGVPRRWRLLVGTGNWTAETWGRDAQIDLFWTTEWDAQADVSSDQGQSLADVHAAFVFFDRLLQSLFGTHFAALRDEPLVAGWLNVWREQLALRSHAWQRKSRFVHSLDHPLMNQVEERFPQAGVSTIIAGSGFFEKGSDTIEESPTVLQRLELLGRPSSTRYLVFNPARAGALAGWLSQLAQSPTGESRLQKSQAGKWTLCVPRDPLHKNPHAGRSFLHAKYIAGLGAVNTGEAKATLTFLYLGSGNLSRRGVLTRAALDAQAGASRREVGNVEAGVVLLPGDRIDRVWQRLACGDYASARVIADVVAGEGGELFEPLDPPPLLFLREHQGHLALQRSEVAGGALWLRDAEGQWQHVVAGQDTVNWTAAIPPSVRVRNEDPAVTPAAIEWDVPVLSRDGLFCRRAMPQIPVASVLEALLAFPGAPPYEDEDDGEGETTGGGERAGRAMSATRYPLRTLAVLVETIAQRNVLVTPAEFPYWLTQLRVLLLEQAAQAERTAIRELGVDLFDALRAPGFVPDWFDQQPALRRQYEDLVQDLRLAWCLPAAE